MAKKLRIALSKKQAEFLAKYARDAFTRRHAGPWVAIARAVEEACDFEKRKRGDTPSMNGASSEEARER